MKASLVPIGEEHDWFRVSAVTEITSLPSGFRVVVAAPPEVDRFVEFHFPFVRAFQAMDEGDMLEFWSPPLPGRFLLYRVDAGGWLERVKGDFLQVTATIDAIREWLIVSSDVCVSVLSAYEPSVREYG